MHFDKFNLNLLVAADAVLNARSLTEAARQLHLTQPALSSALKKLREAYGDELVVYNTGEEPELTPLARELRPRIKGLLQQARDTLKLQVDFDPARSEHTFRVVAPDVLELLLLRQVFSEVARDAAGVTLLSQPFSYQSLDVVMNRNVDLAIVADLFASEGYSREPLFTESFSCLVWEGNAQVGESLSREDYLRLPHADIQYPEPPGPHHPAYESLRAVSRQRKVRLQTSLYSTLPHMILGTELIFTTLTGYARWCAARLPVRVVPYPFALPPIHFMVQWQRYRDNDPALRWLRQKLQVAAANYVEAQQVP